MQNIYSSGELQEEAVSRKFRLTASDGRNYNTQFYNLDAIISVGYRVNSKRATQFRQWATKVLKEFAIKGFVLDKKRLENGSFLGEDYFEQLLAEIREIRLSERRFYQKITDIYATSMDYNKNAPTTRDFFAKVQNKLHYAIHGHTASELVLERDVLKNAGKISAKIAKDHAESEFEKYRIVQDRLFESDFDKEIKAITEKMESHNKRDQ
jgi:hypothetical protein